jgi:hypothetical protein
MLGRRLALCALMEPLPLLSPHPSDPPRSYYDHHRHLRRKGLLNALFPIGRENDEFEDSAIERTSP